MGTLACVVPTGEMQRASVVAGEGEGMDPGLWVRDEPVTVGLGATLFRLDTEKFVGVAMAG